MRSMSVYTDPLELLDLATTDGRAAVEFADPRDAKRYLARLNKARGVLSRKQPELYETTYREVIVRLKGSLVEVIDGSHPEASKYLPKFKLV